MRPSSSSTLSIWYLFPLLPVILASPLPQKPFLPGPNITNTSDTQRNTTSADNINLNLNLNLDLDLDLESIDILNPAYDINRYNTLSYPTGDLPPYHLLEVKPRALRRHLQIRDGGRVNRRKVVGSKKRGEQVPWYVPRQDDSDTSSLPDESAPPPQPETGGSGGEGASPSPSSSSSSSSSADQPETPPAQPTTAADTDTDTDTDPKAPDTPFPSTQAPDTPSPSTQAPEAPSTQAPDTPSPSTQAPDTPSTQAPDTPSPSTQAPDTPSTQAPDAPSTSPPSAPSTAAPSTPSTEAPSAPSTAAPSAPSTEAPSAPSTPTETPSAPPAPTPTTDKSSQKPRVPIFSESSAELIQAELAYVRAKYANAMKVLYNAPLAMVDIVVDGGEVQGVEGGKVEGKVTVIPGSEILAPSSTDMPTTTSTVTRMPEMSLSLTDIGPEATQTGVSVKRGIKGKRRDEMSPAVPLVDYIQGSMDVLYYGELGIGSPSQTLTVDFDTGSADLWLPSGCSNCNHGQYDSKRSTTFRDAGKEFSIEYGSGSASGRLAQDVVRLGNTVVKNQYFGAVSEQSEDFADSPHAGVMGMAFSSIASSGQKTYFENLIEQGSVKVPIFSFHLTRHKEQGSQLCIGCYDSSKYTGSFTWLPVVSKTYWSVSMTGFSAKGPGVNALSQTLIGAIDTGTTLIYVPPRIATQFYDQIPGSQPASQYGEGFFQYPCKSDKEIELNIGLNNKGFKWNVQDFNLGRTGRGSSMCVGAILGVNDGFPDDLAIIGDVFLKSWYSVFDQSSRARVGFASSINNS